MIFSAPSVTDYQAVGDGQTDNAAFIQQAIDDKFNSHGGGIVMVPAGNYFISQSIWLKGGVRLIGEGRTATMITSGALDVNTIRFDNSVQNASLEHMTVAGNPANNVGTNTITIPQNALVHLDCVNAFNGWSALYTQGCDGEYHNCYFSGVYSCVVSNGANWYNRVKMDTADNSKPQPYGFLQGIPYPGNTSQENHFTMCDFSGPMGSSINIQGSPGSTITVIEGGVISGPIVIGGAKWTSFVGVEIGNPTFACGANPTSIVGCYGFSSITPSGSKLSKSGNININ